MAADLGCALTEVPGVPEIGAKSMVPEHHVMPPAARVSPRRATAVPRTYGRWLVLQRQARGWSAAQMARKLREAATSAGDRLPGRETLLVMIYRWENDRSGISERYRLHYCRAFQIPVDRFGNPAAVDVPPAGGTGQPGASQAHGKHPGAVVTQPPSLRDRMHAAVDQLCGNEDRDQFCFLLGYLCALVTASPRAPGDEPVNAGPASQGRQP